MGYLVSWLPPCLVASASSCPLTESHSSSPGGPLYIISLLPGCLLHPFGLGVVTRHCHQPLYITALLMNVPPLTQRVRPHLSCSNPDTAISSQVSHRTFYSPHLLTPLSHSLSKYLWRASYMLGTVLETNNRQNRGKNPCLHAPPVELSPPYLLATLLKSLFCS